MEGFIPTLVNIGVSSYSGTFGGCASLESVVFGDGIEEVPAWIFENCSNLTTVVFGKNVKTIGHDAFYRTGIISLDFPDSLETIESAAFMQCTSLESVNFNEGLKTIEYKAFHDCSSIKSIVLPNSLTNIGASSYSGTFGGCASLESVVFGDGIEEIPAWIFENCSNLTTVVFGKNVKTIGNDAFYKCPLTNIQFRGNPIDIPGVTTP